MPVIETKNKRKNLISYGNGKSDSFNPLQGLTECGSLPNDMIQILKKAINNTENKEERKKYKKAMELHSKMAEFVAEKQNKKTSNSQRTPGGDER